MNEDYEKQLEIVIFHNIENNEGIKQCLWHRPQSCPNQLLNSKCQQHT